MQPHITDEQWMRYTRDGYLKIGKILDDEQLAAMQERIDDIMMGRAAVNYDRMLMQLDSETGDYDDAGVQSAGHKGATLNYRKIEQLEEDPLFLSYLQHPVFKEICDRVYGCHVPVGLFRTMFMNKPAGRGTKLPWHQDRWTALDRDPLITVYTAIDPATRENGCVQVIPGSHKLGMINPEHESGFMTDELVKTWCPQERVAYVEMEPGEVYLLHNWLLHGSDKNHSDQPRRALSVCYLDARTRKAEADHAWPIAFGAHALTPESVAAVRGLAANA